MRFGNFERQSAVFILIGLLLSLGWNVSAQRTIITGKVFDASTRESMPFVTLLLKNTTVGTYTDIEGNYRIETDAGSDSILISYVGYKPASKPIVAGKTQVITIFLIPETSSLQEVVVHPGENPAWRIMRKVMEHKEANDPDKMISYQYETYNKIEFDLNNIPTRMENKKVLKPIHFVFNYIDSSNVKEKPYLPAFISESVSDVTVSSSPKVRKEVIKASKLSGFKNKSISQFMGDMYQNVDIYKNTFLLFGQQFNSPITGYWNSYYKYYLIDSVWLDGHRCYQLEFKPRHHEEFAFSGNMWISDTTFALVRIEMTVPGDVNLNFVQSFSVIQDYTCVDSNHWMLAHDKLIVDFALSKKNIGMYGRKNTTYYNFTFNPFHEKRMKYIGNELAILDSADYRSNAYWDSIRPEKLNSREKNIYKMVDTFQSLHVYNHIVHGIILAATGYKTFGNFDVGPVADFISYNTIEGTRYRFGGRTSDNFSDWYELYGYMAYGSIDRATKYDLGLKTFITKKPWQQIDIYYQDDYQILGRTDNLFSAGNILTSLLAREPVSNLTRVEETRFTYDRDIFPGLELKLSLFDRIFIPLGNNTYSYVGSDGQVFQKPEINSPALQLYFNFSYHDRYIVTSMRRVDVGTVYPTFQFQYTAGFKNFLQGDYQYHKIVAGVTGVLHLNPFGDTHYYLGIGKIFGAIPYPLMELHPGNETYIYDPTAYNMMNYYEFASDHYETFHIEHHFEGYFFNKIPYLRELKWREVAVYKILYGSINPQNEQTILFPATLRALNEGPYSEADVGIENILRLIRIDALWRLSYLRPIDDEKVPHFAIMGTFQLTF